MQEKGINLNLSPNVMPIQADEAMIHTKIRAKKEGDGVKKIGHLRIWFIDTLANRVVSDIVVDMGLAESLSALLKRKATELDEELKSDRLPEPHKRPATTSGRETSYIG
jgi:hypothetical protein